MYRALQMSSCPYRNGRDDYLVVNNQVRIHHQPADARSSVLLHRCRQGRAGPHHPCPRRRSGRCALAAQIAFEYRQHFAKDVVIDMLCYRRRGHNSDEPSFTQPLTYGLIEENARWLYTEQLIGRGDISLADAEQAVNKFRGRLEEVSTRS